MKKAQLEMALRAAGEIARDSDFIVFGSQSILGSVSHPPQKCLVSMEVDLYPRRFPQAAGMIVEKLGLRSPFSRKNGFFIDCVSPEVASFPEGWEHRLIRFKTRNTAGVTGWCVEPHDMAASKLAAGREKDFTYVRILLATELITLRLLKARILLLPISASQQPDLIRLIQSWNRPARTKRPSKSNECPPL